MAIPDVPELRDFLTGVRLSPDRPADGQPAARIPFLPAVDEAGYVRERELWLYYPATTKISFTRVRDRINQELQSSRHPKDDNFALFALGLAALAPPAQGEMVARVNKIVSRVCDADVTLYHILRMDFPEQWRVDIPPFTIGPLRVQKLKYNSEKAGSDFFTRYKDELTNAWAIEREPLPTRVLDFPLIQEEVLAGRAAIHARQPWQTRALGALVDWYFSLHNRVLFDDFLSELVSAQSVLLALGAPFFDTRSLQMLSGVIKTHRVAVFLNIGARRQGFVAPGATGPLMIDVAGIHDRVPGILKELKERYGVERFDQSPLHRSIKLFADFVARARRHEIDDHINEALLHYVIALELIFGERQAIQKSVAERVALITFHESGRTFEQQRRFIDSIYELRSRYVHAGTEITDADVLDKLRVLCEQTFRCLLRLQAAHPQSAARGEETLKGWLKELNYLSAGFIAGKQPDEQYLRDAHVLF
jgi:hypothetical protein